MKNCFIVGVLLSLTVMLFAGCELDNRDASKELISDLVFSSYVDMDHPHEGVGKTYKQYYINYYYTDSSDLTVEYIRDGLPIKRVTSSLSARGKKAGNLQFYTKSPGKYQIVFTATKNRKSTTKTTEFEIVE